MEALQNARFLSAQGRWAEAKAIYEKIIEGLEGRLKEYEQTRVPEGTFDSECGCDSS